MRCKEEKRREGFRETLTLSLVPRKPIHPSIDSSIDAPSAMSILVASATGLGSQRRLRLSCPWSRKTWAKGCGGRGHARRSKAAVSYQCVGMATKISSGTRRREVVPQLPATKLNGGSAFLDSDRLDCLTVKTCGD